MSLLLSRVVPLAAFSGRRAPRLLERNMIVYRRNWLILVSGFFEPMFYLFSIGIGLGALVGHVTGPGGQPIGYTSFVAPALLASSAMNGAIYDSTFNVFWQLRYAKVYETMLATPMGVGDIALGQIGWALLRGLLYSVAFLIVMAVMGLAHSAWLVLALPTVLLIGFAFASVGFFCTTFMRGWPDFEFVTLALLPMFLFSTTFYPLGVYPYAVRIIIECTPLYQGIELMRGFSLGALSVGLLWHALYLAIMGVLGLLGASRRLERVLIT